MLMDGPACVGTESRIQDCALGMLGFFVMKQASQRHDVIQLMHSAGLCIGRVQQIFCLTQTNSIKPLSKIHEKNMQGQTSHLKVVHVLSISLSLSIYIYLFFVCLSLTYDPS